MTPVYEKRIHSLEKVLRNQIEPSSNLQSPPETGSRKRSKGQEVCCYSANKCSMLVSHIDLISTLLNDYKKKMADNKNTMTDLRVQIVKQEDQIRSITNRYTSQLNYTKERERDEDWYRYPNGYNINVDDIRGGENDMYSNNIDVSLNHYDNERIWAYRDGTQIISPCGIRERLGFKSWGSRDFNEMMSNQDEVMRELSGVQGDDRDVLVRDFGYNPQPNYYREHDDGRKGENEVYCDMLAYNDNHIRYCENKDTYRRKGKQGYKRIHFASSDSNFQTLFKESDEMVSSKETLKLSLKNEGRLSSRRFPSGISSHFHLDTINTGRSSTRPPITQNKLKPFCHYIQSIIRSSKSKHFHYLIKQILSKKKRQTNPIYTLTNSQYKNISKGVSMLRSKLSKSSLKQLKRRFIKWRVLSTPKHLSEFIKKICLTAKISPTSAIWRMKHLSSSSLPDSSSPAPYAFRNHSILLTTVKRVMERVEKTEKMSSYNSIRHIHTQYDKMSRVNYFIMDSIANASQQKMYRSFNRLMHTSNLFSSCEVKTRHKISAMLASLFRSFRGKAKVGLGVMRRFNLVFSGMRAGKIHRVVRVMDRLFNSWGRRVCRAYAVMCRRQGRRQEGKYKRFMMERCAGIHRESMKRVLERYMNRWRSVVDADGKKYKNMARCVHRLMHYRYKYILYRLMSVYRSEYTEGRHNRECIDEHRDDERVFHRDRSEDVRRIGGEGEMEKKMERVSSIMNRCVAYRIRNAYSRLYENRKNKWYDISLHKMTKHTHIDKYIAYWRIRDSHVTGISSYDTQTSIRLKRLIDIIHMKHISIVSSSFVYIYHHI